jgi:hypothetical protein
MYVYSNYLSNHAISKAKPRDYITSESDSLQVIFCGSPQLLGQFRVFCLVRRLHQLPHRLQIRTLILLRISSHSRRRCRYERRECSPVWRAKNKFTSHRETRGNGHLSENVFTKPGWMVMAVMGMLSASKRFCNSLVHRTLASFVRAGRSISIIARN